MILFPSAVEVDSITIENIASKFLEKQWGNNTFQWKILLSMKVHNLLKYFAESALMM